MIYDWSVGFTHQYFGATLDYAGGAIALSSSTAGPAWMLLIQ